MFQCVLFDSTGANAKLLGVEYVISDATYRALPEAEKKYWHPHTYEVLGGGLAAPGMLVAIFRSKSTSSPIETRTSTHWLTKAPRFP
jgi:hypothetical protein